MSVVIAGRARVGREAAHLEAIQDAVAAKKLALAGVLGGPGKDFVTGAAHVCRGGGSCTLCGWLGSGVERRRGPGRRCGEDE